MEDKICLFCKSLFFDNCTPNCECDPLNCWSISCINKGGIGWSIDSTRTYTKADLIEKLTSTCEAWRKE